MLLEVKLFVKAVFYEQFQTPLIGYHH